MGCAIPPTPRLGVAGSNDQNTARVIGSHPEDEVASPVLPTVSPWLFSLALFDVASCCVGSCPVERPTWLGTLVSQQPARTWGQVQQLQETKSGQQLHNLAKKGSSPSLTLRPLPPHLTPWLQTYWRPWAQGPAHLHLDAWSTKSVRKQMLVTWNHYILAAQ